MDSNIKSLLADCSNNLNLLNSGCDVTFFQQRYKRCENFSHEPIKLMFQNTVTGEKWEPGDKTELVEGHCGHIMVVPDKEK